jgi:hypothetical protein
MQWFKHDSNANMDAKLQEVLLDYGLEGYGLYWYCIELIAGKVGKDNITFKLEHDARVIARNTGTSVTRTEEMMRKFIELGLFEGSYGNITCLKLARRLDQSMTSNPEMRAMIQSLKNHDAVMTPSRDSVTESCKNRIDKNRIDKNKTNTSDKSDIDILNIFGHWCSRMKKANNTKLTKDRKAKIKARLKEGYTVDQIKQAIDGCARSPYHMGQNDQGTVYDDLTLICRNGSKIEWFINNIGKVQGASHGQQNQFTNGQAGLSAVERSAAKINANRAARGEAPLGHAEPSGEALDTTCGHVRVQVPETVRGCSERHLGEVLEGDYSEANG